MYWTPSVRPYVSPSRSDLRKFKFGTVLYSPRKCKSRCRFNIMKSNVNDAYASHGLVTNCTRLIYRWRRLCILRGNVSTQCRMLKTYTFERSYVNVTRSGYASCSVCVVQPDDSGVESLRNFKFGLHVSRHVRLKLACSSRLNWHAAP